jgi:hypothetical protein
MHGGAHEIQACKLETERQVVTLMFLTRAEASVADLDLKNRRGSAGLYPCLPGCLQTTGYIQREREREREEREREG